jgi:hypothetical protein
LTHSVIWCAIFAVTHNAALFRQLHETAQLERRAFITLLGGKAAAAPRSVMTVPTTNGGARQWGDLCDLKSVEDS